MGLRSSIRWAGMPREQRPDRPLPNVVVVTGPHRSGTTVIGALLNEAPRTFLVHEPFNLDWGIVGVPCRYPYMIRDDVTSEPALALRRLLATGQSTWKGNGIPLSGDTARVQRVRRDVQGLGSRGHVAVVKDPFLMLALGWVNRGLSDRPAVVTLRHPCAWVASLARRWMHPRAALRSFRDQRAFGDPVVARILDQRNWESEYLISAGAAAWTCLVRMLRVQLRAGARAVVVRMEDFSAHPLPVLVDLYGRTRLNYPSDVHRTVEDYTGAHNVVTPDRSVMHELRRNSAALATSWRAQLSAEDRREIRRICEEQAAGWYDDW